VGLELDVGKIGRLAARCLECRGQESRIAHCLEAQMGKKQAAATQAALFLLLSELLKLAHQSKRHAYIKLLWRKAKPCLQAVAR
jgi:hypothetical protein